MGTVLCAGAAAVAVPAMMRRSDAGTAGSPRSAGAPITRSIGASVQALGSRPGPSAAPSAAALRPGQAAWVIAENAKPGSRAWRIPAGTPDDIEGYADHVSAQAGDRVTMYVSTDATHFRVEAYRLGYYGGLGARLLWRSGDVGGGLQPEPTTDPSTNMVEAAWTPSLSFTVGSDWPQGDYMLKLVAETGGQRYVPLAVRDDASHAALVIQNSVTTWQAYNRWGGRSLYAGPGGFSDRSRVVSFDRPYDSGWGAGAVMGGNELPVITLVEKLGLDVTYWTDVDLHERPSLLLNHRALISLGHDEYWSTAMRDGALAARDQGVNIAFLGANAVYRHIRMQASPLGEDRQEVDYKSASEDPMSATDPAETTVNWRLPPLSWPESQLLGEMYECNPVNDDMVVSDASSWLFAKTGLHDGDHLAGLVGAEYDRINTHAPTPRSIQVLAHSPVDCNGRESHADVTYYTTRSRAGVFDSGTSIWTTAMGQSCVITGRCGPRASVLVRVTVNLLRAFAVGPAGQRHPSVPNAADVGLALATPIDP
jgi:hypothetical protein